MKIGYARVSDTSQNLDRQIVALRAEGCDRIFSDKASGKAAKGRLELEKAIDALGTDCVFVVAEWHRATRSHEDGLSIVTRIARRGALVKVLDRNYFDLTTDLGKPLLALLSAIASDERSRIVKRAAEGPTIARQKGVKLGRMPKLTGHQLQRAIKRLTTGESARAIAKDCEVSHPTICRLQR
jgi:DNA invertase Pin-like site-specific DNA recombinase